MLWRPLVSVYIRVQGAGILDEIVNQKVPKRLTEVLVEMHRRLLD